MEIDASDPQRGVGQSGGSLGATAPERERPPGLRGNRGPLQLSSSCFVGRNAGHILGVSPAGWVASALLPVAKYPEVGGENRCCLELGQPRTESHWRPVAIGS